MMFIFLLSIKHVMPSSLSYESGMKTGRYKCRLGTCHHVSAKLFSKPIKIALCFHFYAKNRPNDHDQKHDRSSQVVTVFSSLR